MINKILCLMWGHVYKLEMEPIILPQKVIEHHDWYSICDLALRTQIIESCKHCGAIKNECK